MANVEHSTITDPNIHEPKGVAAATANKVYVSDGAGSGSWVATSTFVTSSTGTFNNYIHVIGTSTQVHSGAWEARILDSTSANNITSASINTSTNRISLPAGTYFIDATASSFLTVTGVTDPTGATIRLRDVTSGTTLLVGSGTVAVPGLKLEGTFAATGSVLYDSMTPRVRGTFTLGSTKNLELQWYSTRSVISVPSTLLIGSGETSVTTDIVIWKIS